jgi:hypothetical protein
MFSRNGIRFDGDPAGIKCQVSRCVSFRNTRGFRLKGDQHQIYNITGFDNDPKTDINIAHMKFYGYQDPNDPNNITNDPSFGWPKADGRRGSLAYYGNENSIIKNIVGQTIDNWPLVTYGPYGEEEANYHFSELALNLREQMRDPDNYDFRLKADSILVDGGVVVTGVSDVYNGDAPDAGAYEYGDANYWIPGCKFKKASTPIPPDDSQTVKEDADLMWLEGRDAISSDVWFGTDPESLVFMGNQTTNILDPNTLTDGTTYYWRIDTITAEKTVTGDLWSFMPSYVPLHPTIEPTDDTWIRTGHSTKLCTSQYLDIRGGNRFAFLKFDAAGMMNENVTQVILSLRSKNSFVDTKVHAVADTTWNECDVDGLAGNYPAHDALITELTDIEAGTWNEFDVTSYVTASDVYAFRLSTSGDQKSWYSGDSSYPPKLIFVETINGSPYFDGVTFNRPDATVGVYYTDTIAPMANDPDGDPLTFTIVPGSGPDWLTMDPDGTIYGTPTTANDGGVWTVRVTDDKGAYDESSMTVGVVEAP